MQPGIERSIEKAKGSATGLADLFLWRRLIPLIAATHSIKSRLLLRPPRYLKFLT
jgi:hypothetical protein